MSVINYPPLKHWSRGVAANMRPCQGRDRGFEPRRGRQWLFTKYLSDFQ
jgi:hypothetical protein